MKGVFLSRSLTYFIIKNLKGSYGLFSIVFLILCYVLIFN